MGGQADLSYLPISFNCHICTMGFGDLKNDSGLACLNEYLATRSYLEGHQPSQADAVVFAQLSGPPASKYMNVLRWFNHIKSFGDDVPRFPGVAKDASEYGPIAAASANGKAKAAAKAEESDDDDCDLFGSDDEEEDEAAAKLKEERLAAYAAKKSKKPALIAKSSILLDVKPWDDETDMVEVERLVRTIECDGLLWGASKLVPVGYGIKKLQISCVVEDDKVSTDFLEEQITGFEDHVQSMDIAAFNKI